MIRIDIAPNRKEPGVTEFVTNSFGRIVVGSEIERRRPIGRRNHLAREKPLVNEPIEVEQRVLEHSLQVFRPQRRLIGMCWANCFMRVLGLFARLPGSALVVVLAELVALAEGFFREIQGRRGDARGVRSHIRDEGVRF